MPSPFAGSLTNNQEITVGNRTYQYISAQNRLKDITVAGGGGGGGGGFGSTVTYSFPIAMVAANAVADGSNVVTSWPNAGTLTSFTPTGVNTPEKLIEASNSYIRFNGTDRVVFPEFRPGANWTMLVLMRSAGTSYVTGASGYPGAFISMSFYATTLAMRLDYGYPNPPTVTNVLPALNTLFVGCWSFTSPTLTAYVDGNLVGTITTSASQPLENGQPINMFGAGDVSIGSNNLDIFSLYFNPSATLTPAEILQTSQEMRNAVTGI